MTAFLCARCGLPYPEQGVPYLCPNCGGVFDLPGLPEFWLDKVDPSLPGMWRYRHVFGLSPAAPLISLGEGSTPLLPLEYEGRVAWLKLESLNPTGSYKDRGSAVLLSQLAGRGVREAVEDSSGNAGASFAAYAARAGVNARVFVPESASGPKRSQIEAYGAELVCVPGPRSAAAAAVLEEVNRGAIYASHAFLPFGLPGIATIAFEILEQLGQAPGTVIAPVGHGGLLLGLIHGFLALQQAGIGAAPYFVGVQAKACSPVWAGYTSGLAAIEQAPEGLTVAEGVRVRWPVRAEAILRLLQQLPGQILAVEEDDILPAYVDMARAGFHVEPTSSLVWAAHKQVFGKVPEPIVLILSGSGLKYLPAAK